MMPTGSDNVFTKDIIDAVIKVSVLGTMAVWTFLLIKPFVIPVIWGIILAVAVEPLIAWFSGKIGGRRSLAAGLLVIVIIAALVIPTLSLVSSSVDTVQVVSEEISAGTFKIPPPPKEIADWPVIGAKVFQTWNLFATNLEAALKQFAPELTMAAGTLLDSVGGGIFGLFITLISTAIAGVFIARAELCSAIALKIFTRFAGETGEAIISLATATIRGVMQGVVGVAVIQSVLAAIGMVVVGVPAAGLWAVLILVVAVIQLPTILVMGPIAAYVFSAAETTPAVLFLIWIFLVSSIESVLKPILMARGVDIPMLVILLGALGGMMLFGIIGLFVGAVMLAIMFTLFMAWINEKEENDAVEQ
jgi:predicted PurR-regulated permease PerM